MLAIEVALILPFRQRLVSNLPPKEEVALFKIKPGMITMILACITLLVLLLYVAYLRLARTASWRGPRASRLCIFNFVVVILSFTVVNLYLSHSHRYF